MPVETTKHCVWPAFKGAMLKVPFRQFGDVDFSLFLDPTPCVNEYESPGNVDIRFQASWVFCFVVVCVVGCVCFFLMYNFVIIFVIFVLG